MAPPFSKEAILQGSIDHLCLVCERYLRNERDICLHVATAKHTQNLDSTDYVEKYRNDRVRKVKSWYFCEFCNVVVLTRSSVKLHVDEPKHKQNKSFQSIARLGDVIISRNTTIREEAWHGFIDEKTCVICDAEYENQDEHKRQSTHVINLIQSKVTNEDNIYRMIDNSTFQCLTCNEIVAEITTHLEDEKHNKILQQSATITPLTQRKSEKKAEKVPVMSTSVELINEDCLTREDLPVFNNSESDIVSLETRPTGLEEHADRISGVRKEAEEYGLIYSASNNKIHCPICNKRIPSSMTNIIEHVNGEQHKNNTRTRNKSTNSNQNNDLRLKKCKFLRLPSAHFISIMQSCNGFKFKDIVLNEKYCIGYYCFTFLSKVKERYFRCQVCEVTMSNQEIEEHVKLSRHVMALMEVPVVLCDDSEFIREIRSDIFQCGFCNIVDSWDGMENHLQSTVHRRRKLEARKRLRKYLSINKSHMKCIVSHSQSIAYSLHDDFK